MHPLMPNKLHDKLATAAPIDGVAIGDEKDKATWRIDFKPEATPTQRRAAQNAIDAFNVAIEKQKLRDIDAAKQAACNRICNAPDNQVITAKDLREAGLI